MDDAGVALPTFRERLVVSRARLIERIIGEDDPGRALPDTAWVRMASAARGSSSITSTPA